MKFLILSVLGLLTILSAFPAAFATHSTPFNGSGTGSFTITPPTTVLITGTGHYDHLGLTTLRNPGMITGQAECAQGFTAAEQDTYIGANGDRLSLTVHDTICPTSPTHAILTGSFTVTGGTGRFTHASGSGTVSASVTFTSATTGTFSGTQSGTINY